MFFFFSNRLGCLGSLLLSAGITIALPFHVRNASVLKQDVFMHLVEILLPLNDNSGRPFAAENMPPSGNISPSGSAA